MLHVLRIVAIVVLAAGSFYGVYYLAKRRGLFDADPIAPASGGGISNGKPPRPK